MKRFLHPLNHGEGAVGSTCPNFKANNYYSLDRWGGLYRRHPILALAGPAGKVVLYRLQYVLEQVQFRLITCSKTFLVKLDKMDHGHFARCQRL